MADIVAMDRWRIEEMPNPGNENSLFRIKQCFVDLEEKKVYYDQPQLGPRDNFTSIENARHSLELTRWSWIKNIKEQFDIRIPIIEIPGHYTYYK